MLRPLALLFLFAFGSTEAAAQIRAGAEAPPVHASTWVGETPSELVLAYERPAVIDFWATWCAPCLRTIPHLNALADRYGDRVTFVSVTAHDALATVEAFTEDVPIHTFVALDDQERTYEAFGSPGLPTSFLIGSGGSVVWAGRPGQLSPAMLDAVLSGSERPRPEPVADSTLYSVSVRHAADPLARGVVRYEFDGRFEMGFVNKPVLNVLENLLNMSTSPSLPIRVEGQPPIEPWVDAEVYVSGSMPREEAALFAAEQVARLFGATIQRVDEPESGYVVKFSEP